MADFKDKPEQDAGPDTARSARFPDSDDTRPAEAPGAGGTEGAGAGGRRSEDGPEDGEGPEARLEADAPPEAADAARQGAGAAPGDAAPADMSPSDVSGAPADGTSPQDAGVQDDGRPDDGRPDEGAQETADHNATAEGADPQDAASRNDDTPDAAQGAPEAGAAPRTDAIEEAEIVEAKIVEQLPTDEAPPREGAESPQPAPAAKAPPPPPPRSVGGLFTTLIGGALAAAIGYGAAQYVKPEGWPFPGAGGVTPEALEALSARIDALETIADSAPAAADMAVLDALSARIDALEGAADAAELGTLAARIEALEARPMAAPGANAAELEQLRQELDAQRREKEALAARVSEVAETAQAEIGAALERASEIGARAALSQIEGALDTGVPYDAALQDLGAQEVPEALAVAAASGVPTLAELQRDFPEAARAALSAVLKTQTEGAPAERLSAFLRSQLGLRSLAPREGDDADAVLSRAEAVLAAGDVAGALAEIEALPEPGRAALAQWLGAARARAEAIAAADALSRSLNAN